ncbi:unnamed protein product [Rotaria sp. Silwood1]|nr:unnamed protein product [Rotaria sp. Silwood1]CAF0944978.1 unnamed protein product [Rotaria sp. Silwood1]CAF3375529.1 unnamed protein product [Rotaria sp. Silwood1]CAF3395357.1 unnamed protein product [Rotaria sp. Silwood1]CAF4603671.1 unnamed protein product [Rotaria sp. Silwood1]
MLTVSTTIVLIVFASIVSGQILEHIENGKLCTGWQAISRSSVDVNTAQCSGSLGYELAQVSAMFAIRFCCPYQQVTPPIVAPAPTECGRAAVAPIRTRIVGGQDAAPHSWPWLVSLQYHGGHFCGGTLIDEYHVLTAAHCLQDSSMFNSNLKVVAGLHAQSRPNESQVQHKQIASIMNHQGYNENTQENDIAIIRLASPVRLDSYVNVACLPQKDPAVNENVMIAGWGTTSFGGSSPDALRQANVLIMNSCSSVYRYDDSKQMCAGNHQFTKDSCQGDSGGPLMHEANGKWVISGVVSYGHECAKLNYPGVYARVSHYLPWIQNAIATLSAQ